jgi:hypothetical protein
MPSHGTDYAMTDVSIDLRWSAFGDDHGRDRREDRRERGLSRRAPRSIQMGCLGELEEKDFVRLKKYRKAYALLQSLGE